MASKRLKIENLDNLQEPNPEEVFSIQGGEAQLKTLEPSSEAESLIYVDPENPKPYPLPVRPSYPCKPYPIKGDKGRIARISCPVIL